MIDKNITPEIFDKIKEKQQEIEDINGKPVAPPNKLYPMPPSFEDVLWSCQCGTSMGTENVTVGIEYEIECRKCGPMGTIVLKWAPPVNPKRGPHEN